MAALSTVFSDNSHWTNVFRTISGKHWQNRRRDLSAAAFVSTLSSELLAIRESKCLFLTTLESIGGDWNFEGIYRAYEGYDELGIRQTHVRRVSVAIAEMVVDRFATEMRGVGIVLDVNETNSCVFVTQRQTEESDRRTSWMRSTTSFADSS